MEREASIPNNARPRLFLQLSNSSALIDSRLWLVLTHFQVVAGDDPGQGRLI